MLMKIRNVRAQINVEEELINLILNVRMFSIQFDQCHIKLESRKVQARDTGSAGHRIHCSGQDLCDGVRQCTRTKEQAWKHKTLHTEP